MNAIKKGQWLLMVSADSFVVVEAPRDFDPEEAVTGVTVVAQGFGEPPGFGPTVACAKDALAVARAFGAACACGQTCANCEALKTLEQRFTKCVEMKPPAEDGS